MKLGRIGIWRVHLDGTDGVREIEALGFSALWLGGGPGLADVRPYLEITDSLTVATGILSVSQHDPAELAAEHAELRRDFPGRFLLGLGVGHPESTAGYAKPLTTMREYLDAIDAAEPPISRDQRVIAALGPKMLDLAAERSLGAHPYLVTPEHTRFARERLGPEALLAPELTVLVEPDPEAGRARARAEAARYLKRKNYTANLLRHGFSERDLEDGGSDRLVDTVFPHGPAEAIAEAVQAHLDAGADHVCLQTLDHGVPAVEDHRALASALL